jgi:hypothetical protein
MNTVIRWIAFNPIKSAAFFFVMGGLPAFAAARQDIAPIIGAIFCALTVVWMAYLWHWERRALLILLGALIAAPSHAQELPPPEPQGNVEGAGLGGIIVGGCLLTGGGLFVYWFYKRCQRWFGPDPAESATNAPPDIVTQIPTTYTNGATIWLDVAPSYCIDAASEAPVEMHWQVTFTATSPPRMLSIKRTPLSQLMSREAYADRLRACGFALDGTVSHMRDFRPIPESESPYRLDSWGAWNITSIPANPTYTLQCSTNQLDWEDGATVSAPEGAYVQIHEARNESTLFYRVRRN